MTLLLIAQVMISFSLYLAWGVIQTLYIDRNGGGPPMPNTRFTFFVLIWPILIVVMIVSFPFILLGALIRQVRKKDLASGKEGVST